MRGFANLLWVLVIASAGLVFTSCTSKQDLFELPCGSGTLVLHETFTKGFDYSPSTLEFFYIKNGKRRSIGELNSLAFLYHDPRPEEQYLHLRGGGATDAWPVFVSPADFSAAEYQNIRNTLRDNIGKIDASIKARTKIHPISQPRISSVRYVNKQALRFVYLHPTQDSSITVFPNGRVILQVKIGSATRDTVVGYVENQGRKIVFSSESKVDSISAEAVLNEHKSTSGSVISDDFDVQLASVEEFQLASRLWVKRRDSRS